MLSKPFTLQALTEGLAVTIKGDPRCIINGVSTIKEAKAGSITFLMNALYRKYLMTTEASAVILHEEDVADCPCHAVISADPYYTYAKIAAYFDDVVPIVPAIHPTAVIGMGCEIAPSVSIGAHCTVGSGVKVGAHTMIGPGCVIGNDVMIDEHSKLDAKVTLYHRVRLGKRVRLASGVVLGSDGFGFAQHEGVWHKVPQLGSVVIGDDVDIGANTTVDRGAIGDTVIEKGAKLDNLIQIGHNVHIGKHTIIAGCVGIAGSTYIGNHCMIGGASCLAGHITLCDRVVVTGMSSVTKSILQPGMYSSGIVGAVPNHEFRKYNARFYRLEQLMQRVKTLEMTIKEMSADADH